MDAPKHDADLHSTYQVFERLGPSLFDFLRKNNYRPFPLAVVQQFARQMLRSVAYLHELKLVSVVL